MTGLPVGALVVPASTHEDRASELMLEHLTQQGVTGWLELVLVDRGDTAAAARALGRHHDLEARVKPPPAERTRESAFPSPRQMRKVAPTRVAYRVDG